LLLSSANKLILPVFEEFPMSKARIFTFALILSIWLFTTGFLPSTQNPIASTFALPSTGFQAAPVALAVPSFGKISPSNGAPDVPASAAVLKWETIQNYVGPVTYRYCVQTQNKTKCPPGKWVRVGTATTATVRNLKPGITYNWWVRAYDSQNILLAEADGSSHSFWSFTTISLPGSFNKLSPANGVVDQPTNGVQLTWSASLNPVPDHYEYCLDTTNNNRCDTQWTPANSGVALAGLSQNTVYYWQVRAVNASGAAYADGSLNSWRSFTTVIVPNVFNKLSPLNNATGQFANDLSLSWTISQNAISYEYCISTTNNTCSGTWQNAGSATSVPVNGLSYSADYYWQVRAVYSNTSQPADGNIWWKFSTQAPPPLSFSKTFPSDSAQNVYTDVVFTWQVSPGADSYEFCISSPLDTTCGGLPWDSVSGTSYLVLDLLPNTTYFWQVRAINSTGVTEPNSGAWWSFTTQPNQPDPIFTKITPANGAIKTGLSLNLTWNPASLPNATYEVCYDTTNDAACDQNNWLTISSGASFPLTGLSYGTTYYWQVRASNSGGPIYADGDMTAWWSFTTMLPPSKAFFKSSPQNGATSQPINPILTWSASDYGVTYEYCVSTINNACVSSQGWVTTTDHAAVPANLSYNTTYYWQVFAQNSEDTITQSDNGTWWSFTTYPAPPNNFEKIAPANNSTNLPLPVWLTWTDAGTGFTYEYCISQVTPVSCTSWTPASTISAQISNLTPSSRYFWQVRSVDTKGNRVIANNPDWQFSTRPAPPVSSGKMIDTLEDSPVSETLQGADTEFWTFALYGSTLSDNLDLTPSGHFTYTPSHDFNGTITFKFTVSDGINDPVGPYTVTMNFSPVNDAPVLNFIHTPATIRSFETVSFTASATDVDLGASGYLTYWVTPLPSGATINPYTGVFTWTPIWSKTASNTHQFTVFVTDGLANTTQEITIDVLPQAIYLPITIR
jgi:hypothetical protein